MNKALEQLTAAQVKAYALRTGWEEIPTAREDMALLRKDWKGTPYNLALPTDTSLQDYLLRMDEVVRVLAAFLEYTPEQMLSELLQGPQDVVRYRLAHVSLEDGTIGLKQMSKFLTYAEQLLLASACDVIAPKKNHKQPNKYKYAQQFLSVCRMGQTELGSFVAPIICPFTASHAEVSASPTEDFTRKVTTHLFSALSVTHQAIERGEGNRIVDLEGDRQISGNLLKALLDLGELMEGAETDIQAQWASSVVRPQGISSRVVWKQEALVPLGDIVRQLTSTSQSSVLMTEFIGYVVEFKANSLPENREQCEIVLQTDRAKKHISLSPELYEQAIKAHVAGKKVSVTCAQSLAPGKYPVADGLLIL